MSEEPQIQDPEPEEDVESWGELFERTRGFVGDMLSVLVRRPIQGVSRRIRGWLTQTALSITFFCSSIVFLMVGLVLLLEANEVQSYIAYLGVGTIALLLGVIFSLVKK